MYDSHRDEQSSVARLLSHFCKRQSAELGSFGTVHRVLMQIGIEEVLRAKSQPPAPKAVPPARVLMQIGIQEVLRTKS